MIVESYDFENDLLEDIPDRGKPNLRVYAVPKTMVVLGRGSKPDIEVYLKTCKRDGVPLYRRRGGGCSVVLDPGNVLIALALSIDGFGENLRLFDRINRWLIDGLAEIGLEGVVQDGISDLVVGDRKVGGSCIYRARGMLLFSASLLVNPDLERIERYLRHPPREPKYRRGRGHKDFLTTLVNLDPTLSTDGLIHRLKTVLATSSAISSRALF